MADVTCVDLLPSHMCLKLNEGRRHGNLRRFPLHETTAISLLVVRELDDTSARTRCQPRFDFAHKVSGGARRQLNRQWPGRIVLRRFRVLPRVAGGLTDAKERIYFAPTISERFGGIHLNLLKSGRTIPASVGGFWACNPGCNQLQRVAMTPKTLFLYAVFFCCSFTSDAAFSFRSLYSFFTTSNL